MSAPSNRYVQEFVRNASNYVPAKYAIRSEEAMKDFIHKEDQRALNDDCEILFYSCFPNFKQYKNHEEEFLKYVREHNQK